MTEREKILDKVAKLHRHAESAAKIGSEAEAQAFAEMVQRLLLKHKLEMTDVQVEQQEREEPVTEHHIDYARYPDIKIRRVRVDWIVILGRIVAEAHFCRILCYRDSSRLVVVGRRSDAEICEYMIVTMQRLLERMSDKAAYHHRLRCNRDKVPVGRGYRETYITSFLERLEERYQALRAEQEGAGQFALMRLNRADLAVRQYMQARRSGRGITLRSGRSDHAEARIQGRVDADKLELRARAVGSGTPQQNLPSSSRRLT